MRERGGGRGAGDGVGGGGRYDRRAECSGGPHVPGVGFASGIERVIITRGAQGCTVGRKPETKAYVVAADAEARLEAAALARELRTHRISADLDYMGRGMKGQMKSAGNTARFACILGASELEKGVVTLKDMGAGTQEELTREQLINKLKA